MANGSNFKFDIPIPILIIAFFVNFPIGVILTVLKIISAVMNSPGNSNTSNTGTKYYNPSQNGTAGYTYNGRTYTSNSQQAQYNQWQNGQSKTTYGYNPTRTAQMNNNSFTNTQSSSTDNTTFGKVRESSYTGSAAKYYEQQQAQQKAQQKKSEEKKESKPKARKASKAYTVTTVLGIISTVISAFSLFGVRSLTNFLTFSLPAMLVSAGLFVGANFIKKRDVRYERIKAIIGNRDSINLYKLAAASDVTLKQVKKDVQKMIDKGIFGETAYIDLGTNNFMRSPSAVPDDPAQIDYDKIYGIHKKDKTSSQSSPEKSEKEYFDSIISEIRRLNDEIKDREVSDRIDKIEQSTSKIFDYVTDHPNALPKIRTFLNYYLPTTLKLLESYSTIEKAGVAGDNMQKSKENIEQILDMLVYGFDQQLDQLFKNQSMDISSDISVLEAMMKKDGLSSDKTSDIASMLENYSDEISDEISDEGSGGTAAATMPADEQK